MTHIDDIEAGLRTRLLVLTPRASAITRDLRAGHDDDSEERATERENDDVLERLDALTRDEVTAIRHALDRIDSGRYGICEECQHGIALERLAAAPTATQCLACAAKRSLSNGQPKA